MSFNRVNFLSVVPPRPTCNFGKSFTEVTGLNFKIQVCRACAYSHVPPASASPMLPSLRAPSIHMYRLLRRPPKLYRSASMSPNRTEQEVNFLFQKTSGTRAQAHAQFGVLSMVVVCRFVLRCSSTSPKKFARHTLMK